MWDYDGYAERELDAFHEALLNHWENGEMVYPAGTTFPEKFPLEHPADYELPDEDEFPF